MTLDVVAKADGVIFELAGDRAVLLDADGTEMITLNPTGTLVWRAIDGRRSTAELAAEVHAAVTGVELADVTDDVVAFVDELRALGLVADAGR